MIIEIDGSVYMLKVKETYMNDNKEFVEEILPLDEWSEIVKKKAISSLFLIEEILTDIIGKPIRLSEDYPEVKKPILNFSGSVNRLPNNLILEKVK